MRRLLSTLFTVSLLAGLVVGGAAPAGAAQAYGSNIFGTVDLPQWPCQGGCTTTGSSMCCANGIAGGPDWNSSYINNTAVTYQTTNCLLDSFTITVDSTAYPFGANVGVATLSLQRAGYAVAGTMAFASAIGQGSGTYEVTGTVTFGLAGGDVTLSAENACLGGARNPLRMTFDLVAVRVSAA